MTLRFDAQAPPSEDSGPVPPREAAEPGLLPPGHRVPSFLALRLHQVCQGIMTEVLAPSGLRWGEYGALTTLDAEPGLDQQRLATRLGTDRASTGQMLDRLERAGLVDRRAHPADRRARALHLTPKGLALRRRLQPDALAAQDRILCALNLAERRTLIALLGRVVEGHRAYARPGHGRSRPRGRGTQEEDAR